jgi:hypothetical protein
MTLTAGELKELLEDVSDETPIHLAHQPRYPLEYTAQQAVLSEDEDGNPVVFIAEGIQVGYLSGVAGLELGWSER